METGGYTISTMLDKRTKKANGKHPIKLRVFTNVPKGYFKLYGLGSEYACTPAEFKAMKQGSPRGELKAMRDELKAIEAHATQIASGIKPFNLPEFEQALNHNQPKPETLDQVMEVIIERLNKVERVRTSIAYQLALKSIRGYHKKNRILFHEVTPGWLEGYERWMVKEHGRSLTTVGIYLRNIRAAFNEAIEKNMVSRERYPFGRRKYTIPGGQSVKKALSKDQLAQLIALPLEQGTHQHRARALWLFSFIVNGINFRDIAELKNKDLSGEEISFFRKKNELTKKANRRPVIAFLHPLAKQVIEAYGNEDKSPNAYLFNVLTDEMKEPERIRAVQNLTRFVNQHMKKLAKDAGLPTEISTYWARHTFATLAIQGGASLEFIQFALNHQNSKTTLNYIGGLEAEKRKQVAEFLIPISNPKL